MSKPLLMKLLLWALAPLLIMLNGLSQAQSLPSISPDPRQPVGQRAPALDVKHISLDLRFDWKKKQAYGTASLTLAPLTKSKTIVLDAAMLTIHSVTLVNGSSLKFTYDGSDKRDNLLIELDRFYKPTEEVTLKIAYHTNYVNETDPNNLGGSYGKGLRFFGPTVTDPRKRRQIWSAGIPESNRYWFPCHDSPDDFRTTEFAFSVDNNLTAVSNGVLISTQQNPDGSKTFRWKMNKPYANHQSSVVVGEYVDLQERIDGVDIHNYSYPDEVDAVKASTARLTDMMRFFSSKIGMPYPYPNYNQVFVQEFPWGGGHNMNSSTLSDNMVDDEGTHADFLYLWDGVEGNDLAAQWFGNLLTPKSWEHAWLNKSFASYFSCLYSEYKNGEDDFQLWTRSFNQNTYLGDWYAGVRRPLVTSHYENPGTMTSDNYALYQGAEVLHMLRKQLGDDNWWKSIAHYVRTNAHRIVTTEDFLRSIKKATGQDMTWFFEQWIYGIGHPIFEVTKRYDSAAKKLYVSIRQTQQKDSVDVFPHAAYFKGWMDIAMDERMERVWLEAKEENTFSWSFLSQPQLVRVDYGNSWVKEMKFKKSTEELLYQFLHDKDITGSSAAMMELAAMAKGDSVSADDKRRIVQAFQTLIASNSYWRIRASALAQLRGICKPPYDAATLALVKSLIEKESSWLKSSAVSFLGTTNDPQYASLYVECLKDKSDRVVASAALALAKSKAPNAFDILMKLKDKPSWKNQSLMSTLNAMRILEDPRTVDIALDALKDNPARPRWTLANNSWDYRVVAAETLAAFGKGSEGFPVVLERFKKSMEEGDVNDIFNNAMLIAILGDARGLTVFDQLREKFKEDPNALVAVEQYDSQLKQTIKDR